MQNYLFTALCNTSSDCVFLTKTESKIDCKTHHTCFTISALDLSDDISMENEDSDKADDDNMVELNPQLIKAPMSLFHVSCHMTYDL